MNTATTTRVLFVAWQHPDTRAYHTVGRLLHGVGHNADQYEFAYVQGALEARTEGFEPFRAFPSENLHDVFRSGTLFPFFTNRLMSRKRADYPDYLARLGLEVGQDDPMTVLGRSGGARFTDDVEVFPMPELIFAEDWGGHCYETYFFAHGLRYLHPAEQQRVLRLHTGEQLNCRPEPENAADQNAMLLLTLDDIRTGYVPRYLAPDARQLFDECVGTEVMVQQLNAPPAPRGQRLLCRLRTCWPAEFRPYRQERYQPVSRYATGIAPSII